MRTQLFSDSQFDQMADEVEEILREVGYGVDHPVVKAMALSAGCRESAAGRVLFDNRQIDDLRGRLRRQYPPLSPGSPERSLIHPRRPLKVGFGNLTPKVFDYADDRPKGGDLASFTDLVKFAHMEKRYRNITLPLSRQDVLPSVEQMESLCVLAGLTDKPIGVVDATVPETVPFLAEMGQVLGHKPAEFIGSCNCINPPLRLEARTADTMLQRRRYHSRSMITSMPALGGNGPVDIVGSIILATAEIVGGLILSIIIDSEAPLMGYIASIQVDMRQGNPSSSSPQTVRLDAGVYQLMEKCFGGGTRIGGRSYISARRPGLQAVFERFLKAIGYSALADQHAFFFSGNGNLDNGSMVSPEQALLDMDIAEGMAWLWTAPEVPAPGDAAQRLMDGIENADGNFMTSEHTLAHYWDEMWESACFPCLGNTRTEKDILDHCHQEYCCRVKQYQPTSYPEPVLKELKRILNKARSALASG